MAFDNDTIQADQRRTVVVARIHLDGQVPENGPCQQRLQLREPVALELAFQVVGAEADRAFHGLQRDVTREAVRHDHVGPPGKQVAAFDEADVVHRAGIEHGRGVLDRVMPLRVFGTDVEQRHARAVDAEDILGHDRSHDRVLEQVLGGTECIRAEVQHVQ